MPVLYATDEGLCGRNFLQSVVIDTAMGLLAFYSPTLNSISMSLYNIFTLLSCLLAPHKYHGSEKVGDSMPD